MNPARHHEATLGAGWSDGLPLVPPSCELVSRMLTGTARSRDEVLGTVPPMYAALSVGQVAANAVMAGCEPGHLRVVLAAVEAMLTESFNLHGVHATTMGATPVLIVSGPVQAEAGLNSSHGALGSGTRGNAVIGRALKLILQNVGGAKLGGTESTTLGTPMKFGTMCVAEAEEVAAAHGWLPYHVASRGYNAGDSCVTVLACTSGPHQLVDFATRDAPTLLGLRTSLPGALQALPQAAVLCCPVVGRLPLHRRLEPGRAVRHGLPGGLPGRLPGARPLPAGGRGGANLHFHEVARI